MHKHGTKTTPVFLPADVEASWSPLPSLVSLQRVATVPPENTYSRILKVAGQVSESATSTLITATQSQLIHDSDSILTNLVGKDELKD